MLYNKHSNPYSVLSSKLLIQYGYTLFYIGEMGITENKNERTNFSDVVLIYNKHDE